MGTLSINPGGRTRTSETLTGWLLARNLSAAGNMVKHGGSYTGKVRRLHLGQHLVSDLCFVPSKGKLVSPREERIRGALKYAWRDGPSQPAKQPSKSVRSCLCLISGSNGYVCSVSILLDSWRLL